MTSSPVVVPSVAELEKLRETGQAVGYRGIHIYLRYRAVLRMIEGMRFERALSIGCGFGIFDRLLPPDLDYEGMDLGEDEIAFAREWSARERPTFRYTLGRFTDRPPEPGAFDLILMSEVLEHMPEPEVRATLEKAAESLAAGGVLLITVPNHLHLRNRVRRLLHRPTVWMDETHLREYELDEAKRLLDGLPLSLRRFEPAILYFPKEPLVARLIPPASPIRDRVIARVPQIASHFAMLAEKQP